ETHAPEVILLDHQLPDGNAIDFLRWAREKENKARIVVLTAHGSIPLAAEAIKLGAEQFLTKPGELDSLRVWLEKRAERNRETGRDLALRCIEGKNGRKRFLHESPAKRRVEEVARSVAGSNVPRYIRGDTGSGKGVLARWLHQGSDRSDEA